MIAASIVVAMFSDWDDFEQGLREGHEQLLQCSGWNPVAGRRMMQRLPHLALCPLW
jgi:hypothetical protein